MISDLQVSTVMGNRTVLASGLFVGVMVCVAIMAPWMTPYKPNTVDPWNTLAGSSRAHPFGTDALGRDIYTRVIYATRVSLVVGIGGVGFALLFGTTLGCLSGYFGGHLDTVIMRVMDVLFAFPSILLALLIVLAVGPGTPGVVMAIAIVYTAPFARLIRGSALSIKNNLYVDAARLSGAPDHYIILRHVLPNMRGAVVVMSTLRLGHAILVEASLSFLGLGIRPPTPAWGSMLREGKDYIEQSPWMVIGAGLATGVCILAFNLLGDGMRDVLDPTMTQ